MRIRELLESTAQVMYHVSRNANQKSILAQGLLAKNKEHLNIERTPGVYLFARLDSAVDWAFWAALYEQQSMDIWQVALPTDYDIKKDSHPEMKDFDAYVGYDTILPKQLKVLKIQPAPKSAKEAPPFSN